MHVYLTDILIAWANSMLCLIGCLFLYFFFVLCLSPILLFFALMAFHCN